MHIILFEDVGYLDLAPLTWLRAAFELRFGCDTLLDKVRRHLHPTGVGCITRPALEAVMRERYPDFGPATSDCVLLNSRTIVTADVELPPVGTAWMDGATLIATRVTAAETAKLDHSTFLDAGKLGASLTGRKPIPVPEGVRLLHHPWELAIGNAAELQRQLRGCVGIDGRVYTGAHLVNRSRICVARDASIKPGAVLDAEGGPIKVDCGAIVEPNAVIQGPCYIGPGSIVRPTSVIREGTSIGPVCKVGGEIEGSILQGYANKQHDGFLGHSFVASWANLGADTVTSDLKNTYGTIRVRINGVEIETGQRFVGSTIGDHSKTGIGTVLPTGCVIGFGSQVFTPLGVPKFVPSMAWVTESGVEQARIDKVIEIARTVMARRKIELSAAEEALMRAAASDARAAESTAWR